LLGVFPVLAAVADLVQDLSGRLPSDHAGAFAALAGRPFSAVTGSAPGAARYIRMLETGYAVHELVFGVLFLLIVAIPLRRGQWWAWAACWVVLLADLGYRSTFGSHDPTIAGRATIAAAGLPILLIAFAAARLALRRHDRLDVAPAPSSRLRRGERT
jgi:hypothetical protein